MGRGLLKESTTKKIADFQLPIADWQVGTRRVMNYPYRHSQIEHNRQSEIGNGLR